MDNPELRRRIPSGPSTIFENRAGWARTYLKKAGLIEPVARGQYRITRRRLDLLASKPTKIDLSILRQYPEFLNFINAKAEDQAETKSDDVPLLDAQTPLEILEGAYQGLRQELIRSSDVISATGEMISRPESSKLMNP